MSQQPAAQPNRNGKACLFGCLALVALGLLALGGTAAGLFFAFRSVTENYLDEKPVALPRADLSDTDRAALQARVQDFVAALEGGDDPSGPLVLTADEVNALVAAYAGQRGFDPPVHVSFDGDKINGQLSIPLLGRYLNGQATLVAAISDGRPLVFVDSLNLAGATVPDSIMTGLRTENLAKSVVNDPALMAYVEKLEYITVQDGKLKITAKGAQ